MEILLWIVPLLLAPVGWYVWPLIVQASVRGEFQPSLVARVQEVLSPHTGEAASPDFLADLQRQVEVVIRDTLVDLHREFDDLIVTVKNDDLLGPCCFVSTDGGPEIPLAEFAASLRA